MKATVLRARRMRRRYPAALLSRPPIELVVVVFIFASTSAWMIPSSAPSATVRGVNRSAASDNAAVGTERRSGTALDDDERRSLYLSRIGLGASEIADLLDREPNPADLQLLLRSHLLSVPFENMDQHDHPPHGRSTPSVPRRSSDRLPSLDVLQSIDKIVLNNRGGFCFELNFSFCWLLRSLRYEARLALADVGCQQETPAHVVVLVDGLSEDHPFLVDVGFGLPGVCEVALPLRTDAPPAADPHGDRFRFGDDDASGDGNGRFDTVLYRTRVDTETEEPMYRFHSEDAMPFDSGEFAEGLRRVLTDSPTFTGKRICVLSTERGHVTLGSDYIKWVEMWETVHRVELPTETEWRAALADNFGIRLIP